MTSAGSRQQQVNSEGPVLLSAGGTGGHMFPAFALARELKSRGVDVALATDARGAKYRAQYPDIPFHVLRAETLRAGFVAKLRLMIDLLIGTGQAFMLLKRLKPRAVIGFGGYPSFPSVIAAQLLKIPTIIHEQNAVLGRANKMLAGGARVIALALPDLNALPQAWQGKAIVTGNPVRGEIVEVGTRAYVPPSADGPFRLLVLGGSQGAAVFSKTVPEAIGLLPDALKKRIGVIQQCRAADIGMARHAYDVLGITARLETFITDVPAQMEACHLIITRSGASTVTEVAIAGRPAIFVPYPHHKDQQQRANAQILAKAGAAVMLDEKTMTTRTLAKELEQLMANPASLAKMAVLGQKTLVGDAAKRLADAIISL